MYAGPILASAGAGDEWDVRFRQGRAACSAQKAEPLGLAPRQLWILKALCSHSLHQPVCPPESLLPGSWEPVSISGLDTSGPPRPLPSLRLLAGVGAGGNLTALPASEGARISSGFSLNGTPQWREESGMDIFPRAWSTCPFPPRCQGPQWSPGLTETADITFQKEHLLSSCQETL